MATYLYCADESARRDTPVRALTPRAVLLAATRQEAYAAAAALEACLQPRGRQFGVAGVRLETARERRRLVSSLDTLPTVADVAVERDIGDDEWEAACAAAHAALVHGPRGRWQAAVAAATAALSG